LCLWRVEETDVHMLTQQKRPLFQEKRSQNVAHSETPLEGGAHNYTKAGQMRGKKNLRNRHFMKIEESDLLLA